MQNTSSQPHKGRNSATFNQNRASSTRSLQAVNLSRLVAALDIDLLAAALGVSEQSLNSILDGRTQGQFLEQQAHISHCLAEAGFPRSWLNTPSAILRPEHINALRKLAGQSANKAPLRRNNLRKLMAAFGGRFNVLADALEVNEESLHGVSGGRLEFNDQRFNHFNPRLMEAGFEDGWLDLPAAGLNDEMVNALEALATDAYERSFEEQASAPAQAATPALPPIPPAPRAPAPLPQRAPAPVAAAPVTPTISVPRTQPLIILKAPTPRAPIIQKEFIMNTPQPVTSTLKLPRGVFAAGKPLTKPPATPATPPKAALVASARAAKEGAQAAPRRSLGISRDDGVTVPQSLSRAQALDELLSTARRGAKVTLWRDLLASSLPYWGNIRRGTVLFRDELAERTTNALELPKGWLDNPTFPPATLAAWVTDANVPLPIAQSTAQPRAVAPAEAPVYTSVSRPYLKPAPLAPTLVMAPAPAAPVAPVFAPAPVQQAPAPVEVAAQPAPPAAPPAPRVVAPRAVVAAPPPAVAAVAPVAPPTPAPTQAQIAATVPTQQSGFAWAPSADPRPIVAPGPLTQALVSVLNQLSMDGKFTEGDAMRMIHFLMAP